MWCNERVLELIKLFQNTECLWDTSHQGYKNKIKKQEAWDSIAKTLDLPVKEVESKIHTLRSQFIRERKKIRSSKNGEDVKITWFAYEPMIFLTKGESTPGNKDAIEKNVRNPSSESPTRTWPVFYVDKNDPMERETEPKTRGRQPDQTEKINQNQTKRLLKKRSYDDKEDDAYEIIPNVKRRLEDRDTVVDDFEIYGKYVASELRNIKDEYSALIAKQNINNILIDARIGKYRQEYTYIYKTERTCSPGPSTSNDS